MGGRSRLSGRQYVAGLLIFSAVFSGTLVSSLHRLGGDSGDFNQFIGDGRLAISTQQLGEALPLEYPPTARPLFMVMAAGPSRMTLVVWWLVNVWMYWQSAVWLGRCVQSGDSPFSPVAVLCIPALALTGVVSDLSVGQLSGLMVFCIVGCFEFDRRQRPLIAGVLLALPLMIKPLPIVLLPYFLLRGRWRTIGAGAVTFILLGPVMLTCLFGWDIHTEGWRWFVESTLQARSPLYVFDHWAELPGQCLTYRESGLASSLIRLFCDVSYHKSGASVQIAGLGPGSLLAIWMVLIGGLSAWASWVTLRHDRPHARLHAYAAFVGIMLLANPKFISYWLAVTMVVAAPLAGRYWAARRVGVADRLSLGALVVWVVSGMTLGMLPVLRAAGSIPLGILAITLANLIHARCCWPGPSFSSTVRRRTEEEVLSAES